MSADKKPRADAKLKTLPEERQQDIYARINLPADQGGGYAGALAWLKEDGFSTSLAALSEFYSWYGLRQQLSRNQSVVETMLQEAQKSDPDLSAEKIQRMGQAFFSAMALDTQDPKVWAMTQRLELRKEWLALERKKFQRETVELFIKWAEDKQAVEMATSDAPKPVKMEKLGQQMFGDLW